jgi:hydroxyethylthiazole kinase-like uncharacterized protein yjeF
MSKIFSSDQIKRADQFTIENEPISSVDLMERAGIRLAEAIDEVFLELNDYVIFAGPGNNGGDGLVIARWLTDHKKNVKVYILQSDHYSKEFIINLDRLKNSGVEPIYLSTVEQIKELRFSDFAVFIDALYGNGLNRPLEGLALDLIQFINDTSNFIISVDLPSGLSADASHVSTKENTVVADYTLTIQFPKLSFFFSENELFIGEWKIVSIDLDKRFIEKENTSHFYLDEVMIRDMVKPRSAFSHKGTFGHALIIAGSKGKIGASILSGLSTLRTGCGLLTMHIPGGGVDAVHSSLPEAMVIADSNEDYITDHINDVTKFNAIGFGPGVDKEKETAHVLKMLIQNASQSLVIDADGLNIVSENLTWLQFMNGSTILTPHPGEFDRLTKKHSLGFERYQTQLEFSKKYGVYIVLKGHYTSITTPSGLTFFNTTGNNGMATGGSGDVLTGIITSLCAQGYSPLHASLLGVYLHGYAGDRAAEDESKTSLIASDIIEHIPAFFLDFER